MVATCDASGFEVAGVAGCILDPWYVHVSVPQVVSRYDSAEVEDDTGIDASRFVNGVPPDEFVRPMTIGQDPRS